MASAPTPSLGTRAHPWLRLALLPGGAVQNISRELSIYEIGEKAEA